MALLLRGGQGDAVGAWREQRPTDADAECHRHHRERRHAHSVPPQDTTNGAERAPILGNRLRLRSVDDGMPASVVGDIGRSGRRLLGRRLHTGLDGGGRHRRSSRVLQLPQPPGLGIREDAVTTIGPALESPQLVSVRLRLHRRHPPHV